MANVTLVLSLLLACASLAAAVPLQLLNDTRARCMDGSQSGFYLRSGSGADTRRWILHLEGGGECTTEAACKKLLTTPLGSSKYFASDYNGFSFYQNPSCTDNPDLCQWNAVFIPYCTQDLHSGMRSSPSSDSWGLYFTGRYVFDAVVNALLASHNFANATDVIVAGDSAGGIGTWLHVDRLAAKLPHARVVAAPVAGFYFPAYPYTGINHTSSSLADFRPAAWPGHVQLWNSSVDDSCAKALGSSAWQCMLANASFPYITSEAFIAEAQTDQVVLLDHDWVPLSYLTQPPEQAYLAAWAANMSQALTRPLSSMRNGVFNPACFIHTGFSPAQPTIDGLNFLQVFGNWYFKRGGVTKVYDTCGIMCNPTCPSSSD